MNEETIFHAAQAAAPAERSALLDRVCGGDAVVRRRVEALLRAHENPGGFMTGSPVGHLPAAGPRGGNGEDGGAARPWPIAEGPGSSVGPYRLLEQLGEGGMGVVFLAEQVTPVRRQVAVKVIKAGMDTRQVVARFEAERQALAMMDHPNIAKVLDAGATESGRPYFVMELVRGVPITRYCDEQRLTPRQRLGLFVRVCFAVQHAHQKGVIHRDLKPGNVLVALYDGTAVPKVIDFGVAKAAGPALTERTVFTGFGHVVGTLEYMSPEQAEFNPLDVDTRSDVYALGVLLYELLTGTTPLSAQRSRQAALQEALRIIREEEPPRPSTRLTTVADQLPAIAASRGLAPSELTGSVRGELDWIVMKALEKDRARRYDTAHGLGRDVERYLNDEPVQACPPSPAYRFRKVARRYRGWLMTGAVLAAVLSAATVVSTWLAVRATRAERFAQGRADAEADARRDAEAARKQAGTEAEKAKTESAVSAAVIRFINEDLLGRADPPVAPEARQTLRAVVDRASDRIGGRFDGQPAVEAAIRQTLATTYSALGDFRQAEAHIRRALELRRAAWGEDDPRTWAADIQLAWACYHQQRFGEADRLFERVLESRRRVNGDDDLGTLEALQNVGASYGMQPDRLREAEPILRRVAEQYRRRLGEAAVATVAATTSLANVSDSLGHHAEAETLLRDTIAAAARRSPDGPDLTTRLAMVCLGNILSVRGRHDEALAVIGTALEAQRNALGEQNPNTLQMRWVLAQVLDRKGEHEQAWRAAEEALALRLKIQGPDHAATRDTASFLAAGYSRRAWELSKHAPGPGDGNPAAALGFARRAVELEATSATGWRALGSAEYRAGHWQAAVDALEKSCALDSNPPGGDALQWVFLAMANAKLGERDLALAWFTAACQATNGDPALRVEAAELLQVPAHWPPPDWQPGDADERVYGRMVALNPHSTWPSQAAHRPRSARGGVAEPR